MNTTKIEQKTNFEKTSKKLKKLLKNLLTKTSDCDIINKPTERDRQDPQKRSSEGLKRKQNHQSSLKIEQQDNLTF